MYRKPRTNPSIDVSESLGLPKGSDGEDSEYSLDDEQRDRAEFSMLTRNGAFLLARHSRTNIPIGADRNSPDHIPSPHSTLDRRREKARVTGVIVAGALDSVGKDGLARGHRQGSGGSSMGGGMGSGERGNRSGSDGGRAGNEEAFTGDPDFADHEGEVLHAQKTRSLQSMYGLCARVGVLLACVFAVILAGGLVYLQNHPKVLHRLRAANHNHSGWFPMNVSAVSLELRAELQTAMFPQANGVSEKHIYRAENRNKNKEKRTGFFGWSSKAKEMVPATENAPPTLKKKNNKNKEKEKRTGIGFFGWSSKANENASATENAPPALNGKARSEYRTDTIMMNATWAALHRGFEGCSILWYHGVELSRNQAMVLRVRLIAAVQWSTDCAVEIPALVDAWLSEVLPVAFWKDAAGTHTRRRIAQGVSTVLLGSLSYLAFVWTHGKLPKATVVDEDDDAGNGGDDSVDGIADDDIADDGIADDGNESNNTDDNHKINNSKNENATTKEVARLAGNPQKPLPAEGNSAQTPASDLPDSPTSQEEKSRVFVLNTSAMSLSYRSPGRVSDTRVVGKASDADMGVRADGRCDSDSDSGDSGGDAPILKPNELVSALRAMRRHMKTPEKKKTFSQMVFVHMKEDDIEEWTSEGLRMLAMLEPPLSESFCPRRRHPQHSHQPTSSAAPVQSAKSGGEDRPPVYSAEEEVFAAMAAEAGEDYDYGSGGRNYVLRVRPDGLVGGIDATAGSMGHAECSADEWHFAVAGHTPSTTAMHLEWPESPDLAPSDMRNSLMAEGMTNLGAAVSAIDVPNGVTTTTTTTTTTTVDATDSPTFPIPPPNGSATKSTNEGLRSNLSRKSLSVVVPSDDKLGAFPKPPYSSDKHFVQSKKRGSTISPSTRGNAGEKNRSHSLDHAVPNHPDSADQRKQRLTRHSFRFPSPDGHQERSVNALTLSPFGTPGTPGRRRRFSSRSNVSINGGHNGDYSGNDHAMPAEPSSSGPKTMTAFESSQQLKLHRSAAASPRNKDRSFHRNFANVNNVDNGGNGKAEAQCEDLKYTDSGGSAHTPARKTPMHDGIDLGATYPLGTPGVVPVKRSPEHRDKPISDFGGDEGDGEVGGGLGGSYLEKEDTGEIVDSRRPVRPQRPQRNRRSSPDLHGFSRVAASVFDDDPFFNDGGENSDYSDDEPDGSWGGRGSESGSGGGDLAEGVMAGGARSRGSW